MKLPKVELFIIIIFVILGYLLYRELTRKTIINLEKMENTDILNSAGIIISNDQIIFSKPVLFKSNIAGIDMSIPGIDTTDANISFTKPVKFNSTVSGINASISGIDSTGNEIILNKPIKINSTVDIAGSMSVSNNNITINKPTTFNATLNNMNPNMIFTTGMDASGGTITFSKPVRFNSNIESDSMRITKDNLLFSKPTTFTSTVQGITPTINGMDYSGSTINFSKPVKFTSTIDCDNPIGFKNNRFSVGLETNDDFIIRNRNPALPNTTLQMNYNTGNLIINRNGISVMDINNNFLSMLPRGSIIAWNSATIPSGWAECNGQNGTPDLRGRFIRMASNTMANKLNSWGARTVGINITGKADKTVVGNSRSDLNSTILDFNLGDIGGTDHQVMAANEMPAHNHTINDPSHAHSISFHNDDFNGMGGGSNSLENDAGDWNNTRVTTYERTGITINNNGGGAGHNNIPPFYTLIYIMKL